MPRPEKPNHNLRQRAEDELERKTKSSLHGMDRADTERLLHELEVHQIELEIQNQELLRVQKELQESRDRYHDLYDSAPIGYFTLKADFRINAVNASGADQLLATKKNLLEKLFTRFIAPEETDRFYLYLKKAFSTDHKSTLELKMQRADKTPFFARLESARGDHSELHLALIDITERKQAEEELALAKDELEIRVKERTRELAQANEQLKLYGKRITQVQEEERKRIAYELHDDTAQYLSILKLQIDSLIRSGRIQDLEVLNKLRYLEKDADRAFNDVRRYSHELRPGVLEHLGLQAALEQIAEDINKLHQIEIEVNVEGQEPKMQDDVKLAFFRIAQEALNNARKHSGATCAAIDLQFLDGRRVTMKISDDGSGFNARETLASAGTKGNLGLMSMQERARLIGSELKIDSQPGKGTVVTAEINL